MRIRSALLPVVLLAAAVALPAQDGKKPQEPKKGDKQEAQAPKDDKTTAKDPAIVAIDKFIKANAPGKGNAQWRTGMAQPPKLTFTKGHDYFWHVKTNKGDITIKLLPETAPMHVSSTIYLARTGYYDGLSFHRVIPNFMAQGGCPLGSGSGGPGYKYDGEFDPSVKHDRPGLLSMANAGPGTDGSQFFLTFVKTAHLDGKHTIFGMVVSDMAVLKALEAAGTGGGKPTEPLTMERTWVSVVPAPVQPAEEKEGDKAGDKEKGGSDNGGGKKG